MENVKLVCGLLIVGACGGDAAASLLEGAGGALEDAGQALTDAGEWLDGSSARAADDAEVDPAPSKPAPRVLEARCDQVTTVQTSGTLGDTTIERHRARFEVSLAEVRTVWVCDPPHEERDCPEGSPLYSCTGPNPATVCRTAVNVTLGDDGALWVLCDAYGSARVVVD